MKPSINFDEIEKRLITGEMSKRELGEYVKLLEPLAAFKIHDILIRGTPFPDGIKARMDVSPAQVAELSGNLSGVRSPVLRGWRVFPKGIPFPEFFTVEVDLGRPREGTMGGIAGP